MSRVKLAATTTALGLLMAAGCDKKPAGGPPPGGPMGVAVTATAAVERTVPVYIDEIGHTTAFETVTIVPQVSGRIIKRYFEDGQDLKKGQPLFDIDPRPYQAQLAQAEGQLKKDQATKSSADWNVGQDQAALSQKAISEQQMHNDTAARDAAGGSIAVDQAAITQAKLNVEYASIKCPLDGRAGERLVDVGNVVNGGGQTAGTKLLVVNQVDPIYADFTVTEAELSRVQHYMGEGKLKVRVMTPADAQMADMAENPPATQPAAVNPGTDQVADKSAAMTNRPMPSTKPAFQPREGELVFLDNQVQDGSGTVKLRAKVPNADHHFWPGQFVNVRLVLTNRPAVMVPATATQVSQQGLFVYRVDTVDKQMSPTGKSAVPAPVVIGQRHGDMIVIDSGITAGQQVVVTGQTMLQPMAPVMVINAGPPGAMPPPAGPPAKPDPKMMSPGQPGQAKTGPQASAVKLNREGGNL